MQINMTYYGESVNKEIAAMCENSRLDSRDTRSCAKTTKIRIKLISRKLKNVVRFDIRS